MNTDSAEGLYTRFLLYGGYPGISCDANDKSKLFFIRYIVNGIIHVMCGFHSSIFISRFFFENTFEGFLNTFYFGLPFVLCWFRLIVVNYKHKNIMACFEVLKKDCLKCVNHTTCGEQIYKAGVRDTNMFSYFFTVFTYASVPLWTGKPIMKYAYNKYYNVTDASPDDYTVLFLRYPFDVLQSPVLEIILTYEVLLFFIEVELFMFLDLLFACVANMLCVQFCVISSALASLKHEVICYKNSEFELDDEEIYHRLVECIKDHQKIIR